MEDSRSTTPPGAQISQSHDPDMSRSGTPIREDDNGFNTIQSFNSPPMNKFRMITVCLLNFAGGFNDSAPGALIPYMEK